MARKIRNKPAIAVSGARKVHRDASLIIIACEGEKTEAEYLRFSCFQNSRVKLCIVPSKDGKSAPPYVKENLENEASKYDLRAGDQLWVVMDTDRWVFESHIKPFFSFRIKKIPVQLAISNPCFELFLYLHFDSMPNAPVKDSQAMEKMLRNKIGCYSKSNLIEETYSPYIHKAIQEAEKTKYGTNSLPMNPGTDVGKLLKSIMSRCPVSEKGLTYHMR